MGSGACSAVEVGVALLDWVERDGERDSFLRNPTLFLWLQNRR